MSRARGARVGLLAAVLVAAGALALGAAGPTQPPASGPTQPPASGPTQPPASGPSPQPASDAEQAARGKQLYGVSCAGCHGQQGEGSQQAPALTGVGPASVDFQLSTGRMPLSRPVPQAEHGPPAFSRPDIDALVAYVASLGPGGQPIPQVQPGDVQSGRDLYLRNCASCHASTGVGAALPAGRVAPSVLQDDPTRIAEAIRVGPGLMPQFPAAALTDQQVADIVSYVRALPAQEDHGGWPIGAIGPVTEGFVGWVIGLGALLVVIRLLGKRAPR